MKKFLTLALLLPTISFAEFNAMAVKPTVLEVKKYREISGRLTVKHIHENPRIVITLGSTTKEVRDFVAKLIESDIDKVNCDGDFFLTYEMGAQIINIKSLKLCVDENGDVIAHSIGMKKLSDAEINASKKIIADGLKPLVANPAIAINNSNKPKEVENPNAGFISDKLSKNVAK
jgi:hypothetical protein